MDKKRSIVDYNNITQEMMDALLSQYPYGFDGHTVKFKNAKGENVHAVPFETDDAKYLVKIGSKLEAKLEAYMEESDDYDDDDIASVDFSVSDDDEDDED